MGQKVNDFFAYKILNSIEKNEKKYNIKKIIQWLETNNQRPTYIPLKKLIETHLQLPDFLTNSFTFESLSEMDFEPLVLNNYGEIILGFQQISDAFKKKIKMLPCIYIEQKELNQFKRKQDLFPDSAANCAVPDRYLRIAYNRLPEEKEERRKILEQCFPEHLPSVSKSRKEWIVRLERQKAEYGCWDIDKDLKKGISWWDKTLDFNNIVDSKKMFNKGLVALEDQWMPYAWSQFFSTKKKLPKKMILIHLDDHKDMQSPNISVREDKMLYDTITGNTINFLNPNSIYCAIQSGAIGKGSMITPLVWSLKEIYILHFSFRSQRTEYFQLNKKLNEDCLKLGSGNIALGFEKVYSKPCQQYFEKHAYVSSNNFEDLNLLKCLEGDIFLHIDMDYFSNRFDGNSKWQEEPTRHHEPSLKEQKDHIKLFFDNLEFFSLQKRIVNTSIGLSPNFHPAEYWETTVSDTLERSQLLNII